MLRSSARRPAHRLALAALAGSLAFAPAAYADGLDCGPAIPASSPAPDLGPAVAGGEDPARLADAAARLRAGGLDDLEVIDGLVGAYCRSVSSLPGLTRHERVARVRAFAARATEAVYGSDDEAAILVDLPLAPKTLAGVDDAARKEGLSRVAWIRRTLARALPSGPSPSR
ncbi:hypothetical protein [Salinarimonas soli]|uniref:Glutelin n=1 Tax=Salinarimonas soli TaxID=1638099 RepID=A0A5B2VDZ9_9HYPH|nr:hypothetical protein [Salinarimonas soli]KAA2236589.1 hypothetical protein F0L46_14040 [Salinarimonas soli]